jgi:hypothetical protein
MKDEWFIICELGHSYSRQSQVPKTCLTCGEKITVAVNFGGVVTPFTLTVDPKGNPAIAIRRGAPESANAPDGPTNHARPEVDEMVIEALKERRDASDIYLVQCPWCDWWSYYNQGSHASCRNPNCGRDLTPQIAETITLADYWDDAPYPGDEGAAAQ